MSIKNVTVAELKRKLEANQPVRLVDCREQAEWDESHIQAAEFIPLSQFQELYSKLEDQGAEIIMQCRSGRRSLEACQFLEEKGYKNLSNLEGGILDWIAAGYEVIGK